MPKLDALGGVAIGHLSDLSFVLTHAFHVVYANAGCAENDIEMFAAQLQ